MYTEKERLNAYKYIRRRLNYTLRRVRRTRFLYINNIDMCDMLRDWGYNKNFTARIRIKHFPELFAQKPEGSNKDFWFPLSEDGLIKRLKIINKVITKMEK